MSRSVPPSRPILAAAGSIALSGLGVVFSLIAAIAFGVQPPAGGRLAAVFPPWWDAARAVGAAATAGDIAGVGAAPFIVILRGDPAALGQRARAAGALLLLDPALAGACARPANPT